MSQEIKYIDDISGYKTRKDILQVCAQVLIREFSEDQFRYNFSGIQAIANGEFDTKENINVELCLDAKDRTHSCISLYVDDDFRWGCDAFRLTATGQTFYFCRFKCSVNWPAYGSQPSDEALRTLGFWTKVASVASMIQEQLAEPGIYPGQTATERQEAEDARSAVQLREKLRAIVDTERKNMRVGARKHISVLETEAKPGTDHEFEFGNRVYALQVLPPSGFGAMLLRKKDKIPL